MTLSSVALIVGGMAIIDENAHHLFANVASGDLRVGVTMSDLRLHSIMRSATDIIGDDHSQVAAFTFAGVVLFVLMVRTR